MKPRLLPWLLLPILAGLILGCNSDSGSTTGPDENDPFPATYVGTYTFNALPITGPLTFEIVNQGTLSGTWTGTDSFGDDWTLAITGTVGAGEIHLQIVGGYDLVACDVSGQADGSSTDDYQSFTGTWSVVECHGLGFAGTWQASIQAP